jgi:hypothetical protein
MINMATSAKIDTTTKNIKNLLIFLFLLNGLFLDINTLCSSSRRDSVGIDYFMQNDKKYIRILTFIITN